MSLSLLSKNISQKSLFNQAYIYSKINLEVQSFYKQVTTFTTEKPSLKFFIKYQSRQIQIILTHSSSTLLTQLRMNQKLLYKRLENITPVIGECNFEVVFKLI